MKDIIKEIDQHPYADKGNQKIEFYDPEEENCLKKNKLESETSSGWTLSISSNKEFYSF